MSVGDNKGVFLSLFKPLLSISFKMKLSISALLLATVLATANAATNTASDVNGVKCIRPNNIGAGDGYGYGGYCCKTDDDCRVGCVNKICNGPGKFDFTINPANSGSNFFPQCLEAKNAGSGKKAGWKGYCCKNNNDCHSSCSKHVCTGKENPIYLKPVPTGKSTTTKKSGSTTCTRPNNRGEGKGLGWNGYCCKDSDDCKDACIKGVCNGKANPKFA
ncbi:unnamed protein product [Rhizopus stolonifer]